MKPKLTADAFLAWVETQPAGEDYDAYEPNNCAVGQYAKSLGYRGSTADFRVITDRGARLRVRGLEHSTIWNGKRNFGALAARLRDA